MYELIIDNLCSDVSSNRLSEYWCYHKKDEWLKRWLYIYIYEITDILKLKIFIDIFWEFLQI